MHSEVWINGIKRPFTSGVPQGLILGLIQFNSFVNDLDNGRECPLSDLADNIKLGQVVDAPAHFAAFQRDLHRLEK